jgi:hypothetical protein
VEVKRTGDRASSGNISEDKIRSMIAEIQGAIKTQNAAKILNYYAPFISSELTIKTGNRSETFELEGLKEHTEFLEQTFQQFFCTMSRLKMSFSPSRLKHER